MTIREVKKKLTKAGWTITAGGKHQWKATSPDGTIRVPLPDHGNKDISIGTLKAIEKETGVKM